VEFDLLAGQTGTVLYELQIRSGATSEMATVVLNWRDPVDGAAQEESRTVTRGTLGPAFDRAAPALQMATLAAAAAGGLRNAPPADELSPSELLQWARRLERTRTIRGLEPWLAMLEDCRRLGERRPAARGAN